MSDSDRLDAHLEATQGAQKLTAALAQQVNRTYQDSMGRNTGRSVTDTRGNTTFYDAIFRNTGRSVTSGNTTTVYDSMGRRTGTIRGSR